MDIYNLTPVNSTAARVTSQKGCEGDSNLSDDQLRERLVEHYKRLINKITDLPKKSTERKELIKQSSIIQDRLIELKHLKKTNRGINYFFLDAAKEYLTKHQFDIIFAKAQKLMEESKENDLSA